jgi:hypothetical protein
VAAKRKGPDYAAYLALKAETDNNYLPGQPYGGGFQQLTVTNATPGYPTILTVVETITNQYGDNNFSVGGIGSPGDCWNANPNQVEWRYNATSNTNQSLLNIVVTGYNSATTQATATVNLQFYPFAGAFVGARWTVKGSSTNALNGPYPLTAFSTSGPYTLTFTTTGVTNGTYVNAGMLIQWGGYNITDGTLTKVQVTSSSGPNNVIVTFPSSIAFTSTVGASANLYWSLAGGQATTAGIIGNWMSTAYSASAGMLSFTIPGAVVGTYTTGNIIATFQRALPAWYLADGNTASINYQPGNLTTTASLFYHLMSYVDSHHVQVLFDSSNCSAWSGTAYGFMESASVTGHISYGYEGGPWQAAGMDLTMMYAITGNTQYSDRARLLLDYINNMVATKNYAMITADSGFPARYVWYLHALMYDWLYPTLTSEEKAASINTIKSFYNDMWLVAQAVPFDASASWLADITDCGRTPSTKCQQNLYQWIFAGGTAFADSNYWGGSVTGMSYMAYALAGDDALAPAMIADVDAQFDGQMAPAFNATPGSVGPIASGLSQEFYGYGNRNLARLVQLMVARNSVEGINLFSTTTYAQRIAKAAIYGLQPNGWHAAPEWNTTAEGYSGVFDLGLPQILSVALAGTTEGGWMQYLNKTVAQVAPDGLAAVQNAQFGALGEQLLWTNSTNPQIDYTATQPTYQPVQPGDGHAYYRSAWGSSGLWSWYRASPIQWGPHNTTSAGNIEITRGSDYVLPNSDQWRGCLGYVSDPACPNGNGTSETLLGSGYFNTLFFYDNGESAASGFGAPCFNNTSYYGCQGIYADYNTAPPLSTANSNYVYAGSNLSPAYHGGYPSLAPTPLPSVIALLYFFRDYVAVGDGTFVVCDRAQSKKVMNDGANYIGNIRWHIPTNTPTISGNTVSVVTGASKLYIASFVPSGATPIITPCEIDVGAVMQPYSGAGPWPCIGAVGATKLSNITRIEVSDPSPSVNLDVLTVLYTTSSSGSLPNTMMLSAIDANHLGVLVADIVPKIVVFGKGVNGIATYPDYTSTQYNTATYTASYSGTAKHVVVNMHPNTPWTVQKGGTQVASGTTDESGTIYFTDSSGGSFAVSELPASMTVTDGTPQAAPLNTAFPKALQVTVRDAAGVPVGGATVSFTVPSTGGSATLSSPTALTNAFGVASVTAVANNIPGTYTVTASVGGLSTSFSLTNLLGGGADLALGRTATQSSTLPGYATTGAASAVDGNTDGQFFDGSVTHTNLDTNAWWQVDLGASASINTVVVWNRIDCCSTRLSDFWVFVSNTPFLPTDTPLTLQNRAGTFASHQTTAPNPTTTIPVGAQGRYVRVQLSGTNNLSLAEVQVFGTAGTPTTPTNIALNKPATQSSTLADYATTGPGGAVDGNTDDNFFDGSVTHTNLDTNAWWQVDLGSASTVNSVMIWNRTDCCNSRLNDYWVFVSDTPFLPTDTPTTLQNRAGTFSSHQTTAPNPSTTVAANTQGRYLRVQLTGTNYLSLAEIQVFGQ